jgi:hypothetical protein
VGGGDGAALGDVDVAAVAEFGVICEIGPGDRERLGPGPVRPLPPHLCVRPAQGGDRQRVPVGELAAAGVDLGVEAGADQVADAGLVSVGQGGLRVPDRAELDEPGLHPPGQVGGFGVGPGEQQHVLAAQVVREPHGCRAVVGCFLVGAPDPAVPVVGGDRGQVPVTEPTLASRSHGASNRAPRATPRPGPPGPAGGTFPRRRPRRAARCRRWR